MGEYYSAEHTIGVRGFLLMWKWNIPSAQIMLSSWSNEVGWFKLSIVNLFGVGQIP